MEIKYIFYLCNSNSPYRKAYSVNDVERVIRKDFIRDDKWEPDELVKEGITKYTELQSSTFSRLVDNSLELADKMSDFMKTITFKDKDERQSRELIDTVAKTLERVGNIIKSLTLLKKQVEAEQLEVSNVRGKTEINDYELPE